MTDFEAHMRTALRAEAAALVVAPNVGWARLRGRASRPRTGPVLAAAAVVAVIVGAVTALLVGRTVPGVEVTATAPAGEILIDPRGEMSPPFLDLVAARAELSDDGLRLRWDLGAHAPSRTAQTATWGAAIRWHDGSVQVVLLELSGERWSASISAGCLTLEEVPGPCAGAGALALEPEVDGDHLEVTIPASIVPGGAFSWQAFTRHG